MVLYFSGTGNSRFAAERIAQTIGEEVVDIAKYLRTKTIPTFTESGTYVFAAPCYCSEMARAMTDFIQKATFPQGIKAYFIVTCVSSMGIAPDIARRISAEKGFVYMGTEQVRMPQNYVALFPMMEKEECRRKVNAAIPEIDRIAGNIKRGEKIADKKAKFLAVPLTEMVTNIYSKSMMNTKKFAASDTCVGCGKCESLCPFANIKISKGKPVWGDHCTHCMACINLCPKEAIEYGKKSIGKPRYTGPCHLQ